MAPARPSALRPYPAPADRNRQHPDDDPNINNELFVDPMLGQPLAMYIEKDVSDKEQLAQLLDAHGGSVATGYSGVTYILVDPLKTSGQNLYRQYAGKKGKVVLDARWIRECIKANRLLTYSTNWAGCKVTGEEQAAAQHQQREQHADRTSQEVNGPFPPTSGEQEPQQEPPPPPLHDQHRQHNPPPHATPAASTSSPPRPNQQMMYPMPTVAAVIVDPMNPFPGVAHVYAHPGHPLPPPGLPPHPGWPVAPPNMMAHVMRPIHGQPEPPWEPYHQPDGLQHHPYGGDYRYRETTAPWMPAHPSYYDPPQYEQGYSQSAPYMPDNPSSPEPGEESRGEASVQPSQPAPPPPDDLRPSTGTLVPPEGPRGRKRTRVAATPATPATDLVARSAPARSPTPPARVIKSTYGGNLFTAEDVVYLKKYIDYCQEQGLVLSLREICERVAIKAPHHTFYSWRRYCNKHQIRLSGYVMNQNRDDSPSDDDMDGMDIEEEGDILRGGPGPSTSRMNTSTVTQGDAGGSRNRSPTPPRALYRSTTGKGVAFTKEDVNFLVKYLRYKESQGRIDMVALWKEVATKAPHHSRASWMKYWRRHKHELNHSDGDAPLPAPPEKKMRYINEDDIKLAKFFQHKRPGTSDQQFQEFGLLNGNHPWKGWQEHYRIHKSKIDHLISLLNADQNID